MKRIGQIEIYLHVHNWFTCNSFMFLTAYAIILNVWLELAPTKTNNAAATHNFTAVGLHMHCYSNHSPPAKATLVTCLKIALVHRIHR